ncbi:GNAT family N-acetyltransferase [Brevibacillus sp. 179-C9.3 HS]|uniref:GNAT family N-acetyltransferase n=1 Tax=unclassified Brevibacillus TaxID=2684853 RepID=UPI0039A31C00
MQIISTSDLDKNVVTQFFIKHWGSPQMVISSGVFQCDALDGYAVQGDDSGINGFITFVLENNECEIISLDCVIENKGIGTALLNQVEQTAKEKGCHRMKLVTTNDNLHAMGFYQKRGYLLHELYVNAVAKARQIKPEIPLIADNGIPIRDEILFIKEL